ncbi:hypothetical protein VTO73DRAFT_10049 [Trametes versicolor]
MTPSEGHEGDLVVEGKTISRAKLLFSLTTLTKFDSRNGSFATVILASTVLRDVVSDVYAEYDTGLFTPLGDLSLLSTTEFTQLAHPAFPRHSARIKQSHFCNETARAYSGYIDVEARHLFFYFFESRRNPTRIAPS